MKKSLTIALQLGLLSLSATATALAQQPTVAAALNSASSILPGLPGSSLAEGSIIVVYGSGMGPATLVEAGGFPVPTNLSGTSAQVTVNGTTLDMPIFYTSAIQIAGILPSKTPAGTGSITVTYNQQVSAPSPITVVPSAFGTYAINTQGSGAAVATFADYSVIGATHPAHNGDEIVIWGTGLGPISTDDGAAAAPGDLTSVNLQAFIGGVTATVGYHGRSGCCAGLDQVVLTIPPAVSGCNVPVVMQIGDQISNYTSIAVAAPGENTCMDPVTNIGGSTLTNLLSGGTARFGIVDLTRETLSLSFPGVGSSPQTTDGGGADFEKYTVPAGTTTLPSVPASSVSIGACTVFTISGNAADVTTPVTTPVSTSVFLDAGPSIGINGPNGPKTLLKMSTDGFSTYEATLGNGTPGNYLDAGTYTATGPGGVDVGPFTVSLDLPQPLDWTNQAAITTITRSAGQLITWTGGDPNGSVTIAGATELTRADLSFALTEFTCLAPTSAGSFTVPSVVLLSLPASSLSVGGAFMTGVGTLDVFGYTKFQTFTATGLDLGLFFASSGAISTVTYQ